MAKLADTVDFLTALEQRAAEGFYTAVPKFPRQAAPEEKQERRSHDSDNGRSHLWYFRFTRVKRYYTAADFWLETVWTCPQK
jgi:hypothetical protein